MLTLHRVGDGTLACAKGAPEVFLGRCDRLLTAEGEVPLDGAARREILARPRRWRSRRCGSWPSPAGRVCRWQAGPGVTLLGLVGMIDPPRPEAFAAIRTCEAAGIKPVMITGDHPHTARAIARELGILGGRSSPGQSWRDRRGGAGRPGGDVEVYARVSPEDKLRVVEPGGAGGRSSP